VFQVNETEFSLFSRELYEAFKDHPDVVSALGGMEVGRGGVVIPVG
jgi:hypothetical protein